MATTFWKRMAFQTPYGMCYCPVFKYDGLFSSHRTSSGITFFPDNTTYALSGYSSFAAISGETNVLASTYGSVMTSTSTYGSLIPYPNVYRFNMCIYNVSGTAISSRTEWYYNYTTASDAIATRVGMASFSASGRSFNALPLPGYGYQAVIFMIFVDNDGYAFGKFQVFGNNHTDGHHNLNIENTTMPSVGPLGTTSIIGTGPQIVSGDMRTSQLTIPTFDQLVSYLNLVDPPAPPSPDDPYVDVGDSTSGGGNKPYNPFGTDDVDYELLPEVSAVGTGFISLWCPTEQQMLNLSAYMWNADVLTLDFWRKLVADPIQLVYGLNIIPLDLRTIGIVGSTPDTVVVGAISTGIKMDYLTSQWVELDCGTVDIDESMLGSYLDYDPFTKVDIYLPYIGYRPLRVDDIMPGTIQLKYRIDLLTGACVAQIKATKSNEHDDTLNSIVYQFMGNCATQIPVTASQYADAVRSAITTAAAVGTIAVLAGTGAGAGVAAAGAEIMPGTQPTGLLGGPGMVPVDSELGVNMARYSQMTSAPSVAESSGGSTLKQAGIIHSAASAGGNVMGIKPSIERSGAIGGAAGMLASQIPYLVFTRPRLAHPTDQNVYTGYPSFMTKTLSELSGFTQIQAIHLEGIACTANELAEIDALLKSGVIF